MKLISKSPQETRKIAEKFATSIKNGGLILLYGELGSGKTEFVKGLAQKLGIENFNVKSPTYTYIREYPLEERVIVHIDLYRLEEIDQFLAEEIMEKAENRDNIIIVEWADRWKQLEDLKKCKRINITYLDSNRREFDIEE